MNGSKFQLTDKQMSATILNTIEMVTWNIADFNKGILSAGNYLCIADTGDYNDHQYNKFQSSLSSDEIDRANAFISIVSRRQYILSHYILRKLLALYLSKDPEAIVYDLSETKKPFLFNPGKMVDFNISHSGNKILIGLSGEGPVGVDIEKKDAAFDFTTFAETHFSENEKKVLFGGSTETTADRFYKIWTAKESWLKLTGEGLNDDLKAIDVYRIPVDNESAVFINSFLFGEYAIAMAYQEEKKTRFLAVDAERL